MKNGIILLSVVSLSLSAACTDSVSPVSDEASEHTFLVSTKTGEVPSSGLTRLFLAERIGEHDNDEALHCCLVRDLTEPAQDGSGLVCTLENMTAQWYKFAFVCVPDGNYGKSPVNIQGDGMFLYDGRAMTDADCSFNDIMIDYSPVLHAQEKDQSLILGDGGDMHIYRKIIDRWLQVSDGQPGLSESVLLQRVTGRLDLDMGIPEDQFEGKVTSVAVDITVPSRVYLHDQADNSVIADESSMISCRFECADVPWNEREHLVVCLSLLPGEITGTVTVKYLKEDDTSQEITGVFPIVSEDSYIAVKSNTVTTVKFNGISDDRFEVRYAGFPGEAGRDPAEIGVAEDEWETDL